MNRITQPTAIIALALLATSTGCGRSAGGASSPKALGPLAPGASFTLFAPAGVPCPIQSAGSMGDLEKGTGVALAGHPSVAQPHQFTVVDAEHRGQWIGAKVRDNSGAQSWLRIPAGQSVTCMTSDPRPYQQALAQVGKTFVFAPWRESCTEVHAVGQSPGALLVEADPGLPLAVNGVELGAPDAKAYAGGAPGGTLWLAFSNGVVKARADTVAGCFSPADAREAQPPQTATQLAHTDPGRCKTSPDGHHVECTTTLGVWTGTVTPQYVALSRGRRTLGPVHFFDNHPVEGGAFASTVVAITSGVGGNERERRLYSAINRASRRVVRKESGGSVRVAPSSSPDLTHRVHIELADLRIGPVQQGTETGSSRYLVRIDRKPNPEKPRLKDRIREAERRVQDAERQYREDQREYDRLKQKAIDECNRQAAKSDNKILGTVCTAGSVASGLIQPSRSDIDSAQSALDEARSKYDAAPDILEEKIMGDWQYEKKTYSRTASVSVTVELRGRDEPRGNPMRIPLSHTWRDYEVRADSQHNVEGHSPDRSFIDNPDRILGPLGRKIVATVAKRVKEAMQRATMQEAMRAFRASGGEASKLGYEDVDASAFVTAGPRLERAVLRNKLQVPAGGGVPLPTAAALLRPDQCLLAVAVGNPGSSIVLSTKNMSHADVRRKNVAIVEVCHSELGGQNSVDTLLLASDSGANVRWGIYTTRAAVEAAPAPAPAPE